MCTSCMCAPMHACGLQIACIVEHVPLHMVLMRWCLDMLVPVPHHVGEGLPVRL
jgi:hypothetical protein